jgi:hypothetical protein
MIFSNAELDANYCRLGFVPDGLNMKLKVGRVELVAIQNPLRGIAVFFTSVRPDVATQYEITLPVLCSPELIAGMIYVNFAQNFREDAAECKRYFQALSIPLFQ